MDDLPADQSERILAGETALKVWREHRGLDQADVARESGVPASELAAYESGRGTLDAEIVGRLARALRVEPNWIEREEHEA